MGKGKRFCNKYAQSVAASDQRQQYALFPISVENVSINSNGMYGSIKIFGTVKRVRYVPGSCNQWEFVGDADEQEK